MNRPQRTEAAIEPPSRPAGRLPEAVPIRERLAWDLADIAGLLGVSKRLLERERAAGKMPPPDIRIGRRVLWRTGTIDAGWIRKGAADDETDPFALLGTGPVVLRFVH